MNIITPLHGIKNFNNTLLGNHIQYKKLEFIRDAHVLLTLYIFSNR